MFGLSVYSVIIGKTMTANAVADHLKKKVLLITLSLVIEKDLTKVCNPDIQVITFTPIF